MTTSLSWREAQEDSPFFRELLGEVDEVDFHRVYMGDPPSRIILASENFAALADYSPLVAGHLLIIPKQPLLSLSAIPEDQWDEFIDIKSRVRAMLIERYTAPIFCEHGSASSLVGGGCVSHAHLQVVPCTMNLLEDFSREGFTIHKIGHERELRRWATKDIPYLYFEDAVGDKFVAEDVDKIPRKYLRVLIAKQLGIGDPYWDWEIVIRKELLRETVRTLAWK